MEKVKNLYLIPILNPFFAKMFQSLFFSLISFSVATSHFFFFFIEERPLMVSLFFLIIYLVAYESLFHIKEEQNVHLQIKQDRFVPNSCLQTDHIAAQVEIYELQLVLQFIL